MSDSTTQKTRPGWAENPKTSTLTTRVEPSLLDALKKKADEDGKPMATVARQLLRQALGLSLLLSVCSGAWATNKSADLGPEMQRRFTESCDWFLINHERQTGRYYEVLVANELAQRYWENGSKDTDGSTVPAPPAPFPTAAGMAPMLSLARPTNLVLALVHDTCRTAIEQDPGVGIKREYFRAVVRQAVDQTFEQYGVTGHRHHALPAQAYRPHR